MPICVTSKTDMENFPLLMLPVAFAIYLVPAGLGQNVVANVYVESSVSCWKIIYTHI